jgi:uncharacterized protein (TIGR00369 family)
MPFAADTLGVQLDEAAPELVVGKLEWNQSLCTTGGLLHGGVLMALADTVGAMCAFLNLPEGAGTATIESKTNFFRPVTAGVVRGLARPLHVGRTTIAVQTELRDDRDRLVGLVTQTQAVLPARV